MTKTLNEFIWTEGTRKKVTDVFVKLRKEGFLARANFRCCQTCAGYELAEKASAFADHGKKVSGCVYWHNQDEESWRKYGTLFLAFGVLDTKKHGEIGQPTVTQGKRIVQLLTEAGLATKWDGTAERRIEVLGEKEIVEDKPKVDLKFDEKYYTYLDGLRISGVTNMYGASPYLQRKYGLDRQKAIDVLADWMKTFEKRNPKG